MPALTETEATILDIAGRDYRYEANREAAVWNELRLAWFPYQQKVNRLIDTEVALAHSPLLVKRLRRIRAARAR